MKMVGADESNGEIPFGYTIDGMYQIILRPGKYFFIRKKKFFWVNFFLCQIFNRLNV